MEWVETTGRTVEEAVALALDQLGVEQADADVEVLDEPKSGLFGRVRSEARVRARVQPTKPRAKEERRERRPAAASSAKRRGAATASDAPAPAVASDAPAVAAEESAPAPAAAPSRSSGGSRRVVDAELDSVPAEIEESGRRFLEGLVEAMGLNADVECSVVNSNMIEFRLQGRDLGVLIGPKAQTLQAVQELLRTVIHYETDSSSGRILLDVAGYREKRRAALIAFTQKVASDVIASGERRALEPMTPADRKVVHDAVNDIAGVRSSSEGEEPARYVVILPA